MQWQDYLGKNARNQIYLKYNQPSGRRIADSKLRTKKFLLDRGFPIPKLYAIFENNDQVQKFTWQDLPGNFVLKPSEGYGGEGIIVVRKKTGRSDEWELMDGSRVDVGFLQLHALDILAGKYSLHGSQDKAFIEERIKINKAFSKFTFQGTPDVRMLVFNKVPIMAMLRLPTKESHGKANLHQGAVGVGIDMATGITTFGVMHNQTIRSVPETKRKLNGIRIPYWEKIMELAIKIQEAIPNLGYLAIDFVIDQEKGPMILELNARPGLSIQIANRAGLRRRLERVIGLETRNVEHGLKIAKALFAESFVDKVKTEEMMKVVDVYEEVLVLGGNGKTKTAVKAKVDTGAFRSSVDKKLAESLGLLRPENIVIKNKIRYRSATGLQKRTIIGLSFYLRGKKIKTVANVSDRSKLQTAMLIGRNDLTTFMVRVGEE